jgi:hypothetical protein
VSRTATGAAAEEPRRPANGAEAAAEIAAAAGSAPEPQGLGLLGGLDFGKLIARRTSTDVLAGVVRLRLARREYVLPVLPIRPNREWKAELENNLVGLLAQVERSGDDLGAILAAFSTQTEPMLQALYSYDRTGVLPAREELEEQATDMEVLLATLEVWQVANPFAAVALGLMGEAEQVELPQIQTPQPPAPTNSRRPSTGGSRKRSRQS